MRVREYRPSDEPILREAYLQRGFPGGWRPMDDAIGVVVVDEDDRPVVLAAAHLIADVRAVVDQGYRTPKWREQAFLLAHDALREQLRLLGVRKVSALLEGNGKGFGRRLERLRGWVKSRGIAYEREV